MLIEMDIQSAQRCMEAASKHEPNWFCIRSQPKREHIAATNLQRLNQLEVFSPRLRSRKMTRRGLVWFTESLFPNYFFARFILQADLENVRFTPGVSHVVQFGGRYAVVPMPTIDDLRRSFGNSDLLLSSEVPSKGDRVTISGAMMDGFEGVVLRVMPAKQRVQVLLEMLGRTSMVELSLASVVPERRPLPHNLLYRPVAAA
jgi:transcriptional antiterminator RfaH